MKEEKKCRLLKLFLIYIIAIIVGLLTAILFKGTKVYATVFYLVVIAGLYVYVKKENIMWRPWLGKANKEGTARIIVFTIFILIFTAFILALRTAIWKEGITEDFTFDIFAFIGSCCLAPLTEEFVCRGIVVDILKEKHSNTFAVFVSAIIFYIIHGNPMNVGAMVFGLFAGWVIIKAKSIIPGMMMHLMWNTVIFFLPVLASNIANAI